MKCLLILLASGLVTSDKLDRTYLPPPEAKYSGGTFNDLILPLEYPREPFIGVPQIAQTTEAMISDMMSAVDYNYKFVFPTSGSDLTPPTSLIDSSLYDSSSQKTSNFNYFPSKKSTVVAQSYISPISRIQKPSDNNNIESDSEQKDYKYDHYVPISQFHEKDRDGYLHNSGQNIFSSLDKNAYFPSNGQNFVHKTASVDVMNQNDQPSIFGYYGGKPMIMISQSSIPQEPNHNEELVSRFEENKNSLPAKSFNQGMQKRIEQTSKLDNAGAMTKPELPKTATSFILNQNAPYTGEPRNEILKLREKIPQEVSEKSSFIINYDHIITPEGYSYNYDTSNGIRAHENATANDGVRAQGSYSYTGDDGKIYTVTYTADENGFQPRGEHLPTPPPVPETIRRVIEQAARDKAAGVVDDGSYDENKYGYKNYEGAMDRYYQFIKTDKKSLRPNSAQPSLNQKTDMKNKDNLLYDGSNMLCNTSITENKSPNQYLPNVKQNINMNSLLNNSPANKKNNNALNKESNGNIMDAQIKLNVKNYYHDEEQNIFPTRKQPNLSNKNSGKMGYKNNPNDQDQVNQNKKSDSATEVTYKHDGYHYVPPVMKVDLYTENLRKQKLIYMSGDTSTPYDIETLPNKRTDFNTIQKIDSTQTLLNDDTVAIDSTRKPYISGPDIQDNADNDNKQASDRKSAVSFENNLDSYSYLPITTPMLIIQESQPVSDYSKSYQFNTYPTALHQFLPSTIEKRVNNPQESPEIAVSQSYVTTTYRPSVFNDGILEVNQNVKIYGLGRPDNAVFEGYSDKAVAYNNNEISSLTAPYEKNIYSENYPASLNPGPIQDTGAPQMVPNQSEFKTNEYVTETPETDSSIITGLYPNISSESSVIEPQGYKIHSPDIPFTKNEMIVGEDFTGLKQLPKFDPDTGYYYK